MEAIREVYWNVPYAWKLGFLGIATGGALIFLLGVLTRARVWSLGRDVEDELKGLGAMGLMWFSVRKFFSRDCILARRLFARSSIRGVMLLFIIWSFLALFTGTVLITFEHYFNLNFFLVGKVYLVFSLILDIAGGLLIIGLVAALIRRYTAPIDKRISSFEDTGLLGLLLIIVLLGFTVEGARLALFKPPALDWSPVGGLFSKVLAASLSEDSLLLLHRGTWLLHGIMATVFIAYLPFSKMFHLFAAQITTSLSTNRYGGIVYEEK